MTEQTSANLVAELVAKVLALDAMRVKNENDVQIRRLALALAAPELARRLQAAETELAKAQVRNRALLEAMAGILAYIEGLDGGDDREEEEMRPGSEWQELASRARALAGQPEGASDE